MKPLYLFLILISTKEVSLKKIISMILLIVGTVQAKEPLTPMVGYLENAVRPCLTDHGKSIAFLSGNHSTSTVNILDTDWSHYIVKEVPDLNTSDRLECGIDSIVILGEKFIRKISTENAIQVDVKCTDATMKLNERVSVGNTLFESDGSAIIVTPFDAFQQSRKLQWPLGSVYDIRHYGESMLFTKIWSDEKKANLYYLVDVNSSKIRDITPQIDKFAYTTLTSTGNYLHLEYTNKENRVFNTKTLERMPALEQFLYSLQKERNKTHYVQFLDQFQNLLLIGTKDTFIAWDMEMQKPKYTLDIRYVISSYEHQEGTVLISGIDRDSKPYSLIDVNSGHIRYQPSAYNKPYTVFIQNDIPKTVLKIGFKGVGIWNLIKHKWEQKFDDDPFFKNFDRAFVTDKYVFFTHDYEKGIDQLRQYSRANGQLLHVYKTDSILNRRDPITLDDTHQRLIINYTDGFNFKVFDTKNGSMLYDLQAPHRNPKVISMSLSYDGKKLIVQTEEGHGAVKVEMGESYKYDNEASIFTWDLDTKKVTVEPCGKSCKQPQSLQSLSASGDGFTVTWDKQHKAIEMTKNDNPYRKIYMYMPYGTSEWIDMDNSGYFDASKGGESYIFMCDDGKCNHIDDAGKKYFKRSDMLKTFLNEKDKN